MKIFGKLLELVGYYLPLDTAYAHCDVPCGIYDPHNAQIGALTVIRMIDIITEHAAHIEDAEKHDQPTLELHHGIIRAVKIKEDHAEIVKHEIRIIWGDYFKPEHFEKYPEISALTHEIMKLGSATKQALDRAQALKLLEKVNRFAEIFWETKGKKTKMVSAPYKPEEMIVIPILD